MSIYSKPAKLTSPLFQPRMTRTTSAVQGESGLTLDPGARGAVPMNGHDEGALPAGFDPAAHPIITRHIFGVEPFPTAEIVADLRFRRQCQHLHALGNRAMTEFLAEIGAERSIMTLIDKKLDRYAEIELETLEVVGGDGFWSAPLREVRRVP